VQHRVGKLNRLPGVQFHVVFGFLGPLRRKTCYVPLPHKQDRERSNQNCLPVLLQERVDRGPLRQLWEPMLVAKIQQTAIEEPEMRLSGFS